MSSSSNSGVGSEDSSEKVKKLKKGKKNDLNPKASEEEGIGSEKVEKTGSSSSSGGLEKVSSEVPLNVKSFRFSIVDFLGKPRWVLTDRKKFHLELLALFREIKGKSLDDIVNRYPEIEPAMVRQCQKIWPMSLDDLQKSYKVRQQSLGCWSKMGDGGFILLPSSEFREVDTIDLDEIEKRLLSQVIWPELSASYQINSAEVFSIASELLISFAGIEAILLKQDRDMEKGSLIFRRLMKPIQFLPQIENIPILLGRAMLARSQLIEALEGLQAICKCELESPVYQNEFKLSLSRRFLETFEKAKLVENFLKIQNLTPEFYEQISFRKMLLSSEPFDVIPIIEKLEEEYDMTIDIISHGEGQDEQTDEKIVLPSEKGYNFSTVLEGGGAGKSRPDKIHPGFRVTGNRKVLV